MPQTDHGPGDAIREDVNTRVLMGQWREGRSEARDHLIGRLYPELSQIAAARLRREYNSSLSTGDLINEAVLRLMQIERIDVTDRAHLIALASRMMRNILIDYARGKRSDKRQHHKVELTTRIEGEQRLDLNSLETALIRLKAIDEALMELVEMRYFGGMTIEDIAMVSGLSEATVKRRWLAARAWLSDALVHPVDHD